MHQAEPPVFGKATFNYEVTPVS